MTNDSIFRWLKIQDILKSTKVSASKDSNHQIQFKYKTLTFTNITVFGVVTELMNTSLSLTDQNHSITVSIPESNWPCGLKVNSLIQIWGVWNGNLINPFKISIKQPSFETILRYELMYKYRLYFQPINKLDIVSLNSLEQQGLLERSEIPMPVKIDSPIAICSDSDFDDFDYTILDDINPQSDIPTQPLPSKVTTSELDKLFRNHTQSGLKLSEIVKSLDADQSQIEFLLQEMIDDFMVYQNDGRFFAL
ncbi:hypothetical protein BC833DRAFT_587285 [Globomyces pollinis-pini]|nr:hypothetical protein BC833DRAFT_587285 [Globomyces pollinis-pini]